MRTARKARAHVEYSIELASSWVLKSVYGIEQYTYKEKGFKFFQSMFRAKTSRARYYHGHTGIVHSSKQGVKDSTGRIKLMTIQQSRSHQSFEIMLRELLIFYSK